MAKFIILSNNVEKHGSFASAIFFLARSLSFSFFRLIIGFPFSLFRNFIFFESAQTDMKNVSYVSYVCVCEGIRHQTMYEQLCI